MLQYQTNGESNNPSNRLGLFDGINTFIWKCEIQHCGIMTLTKSRARFEIQLSCDSLLSFVLASHLNFYWRQPLHLFLSLNVATRVIVTSHSPPHSRHFREASGCAKQRASRQDHKRPCSNLTESKRRNELPGCAIKAHLHGLGTSKCVHTWEELQLCCHRNECITLCSISPELTEKKSLGLTLPNGQLLHTTRKSLCQHEYLLNQATESKHLGSRVIV